MQSCAPTADAGIANGLSGKHTAEVIEMVHCTSSTSAEELACLRSLLLSTLLSSAVEYELSLVPFGGFDVFIPTSPSSFIPDSPSNLLTSGRFAHNTDIIAGWNENDGSLLVPTSLTSDLDVADWLVSTLPDLSRSPCSISSLIFPEQCS